MGVSIQMKVGRKWESITPGWRSQVATWLYEIGGDRDTLAFTDSDIPALEGRKAKQRIGEVDPPFDQSDEWVRCFDRIIKQIREHEVAVVRLSW